MVDFIKINFKMRLIKILFFFIIGMSLVSFKPVEKTKTTFDYYENDKQQLENLIRKTYEWVETKNSNNDFDGIKNKKGDKYIALNLNSHKKRLEEFKKTNFFAQQFIDNYNKIALKIDADLKNKKMEWFIDDMPPFGGDSNSWCNCQDNPEQYWKTMKIKNLKIDNNKASFKWTWSWEGEYSVKAVKENGVWKIAYLEGFDYNSFF